MRILPALSLSVVLVALPCAAEEPAVQLRVLATTDQHGFLLPYDYFTAKPAERGLAKIATLIRKARAENPNTILVDAGDTIQGSPLETVHQLAVMKAGSKDAGNLPADPMMKAMNALGYDAMTVGNHEFNYGLKNLNRARSEARFPWLSANTLLAANSKERPFDAYLIKTVAGVKVAIIGITTPGVPSWEEPGHYAGYRFESGVTAAERAVAEVKSRHSPDVILLVVHAGLGGNSGDLAGENMVNQIASKVPGIDAIVFGHTHAQEPGKRIDGVLAMQPKNWGGSLGVMDLTLAREGGGRWKVTSKTSALWPVNAAVAPDAEIAAIAAPYHEAAEQYLNSPVATAAVALSGRYARVEDTAILDAVQEVQMHYAKADVSFASSFNPRVEVKAGPVTIREIAALYIYDNTLYAVELTGAGLRAALENAARFYRTCPDPACTTGPLIGTRVIGYNYDMAEGVEYEIDLRKPEGSRVVNLRFHGKAVEDGQKFRVAVNNYRAAGSAGYTMFKDARVLWRSNDEIRDLIIEYFSAKKALPVKPSGNWRIIPEAALLVLEAEAAADARRGDNR